MDSWTVELRRWPTLFVVIFGQASNILTVLVLCRPKLRKNTCSLYLIGGSISNTICLFTGLVYYVVSLGFGYSLSSQYRIFCKLLPFVYYSTLFLSAWFILLACTDRYCSTHSKASIRNFCRMYIAKRLIVILPIFTFLIHIHILIYIDMRQIRQCTFLSFNFIVFFYIYYVVVYAFMTPILYSIFAFLTISNVHQAKKKVILAAQKMGSINPPPQRQQTINGQLLRMLLVQVISFVILTMPLAAWNVYIGVSSYQTKSTTTRSLESFLSVNFRILTFVNIGSTLIVYVLTARVFREELVALFHLTEQHFRFFSFSRRVVPTVS